MRKRSEEPWWPLYDAKTGLTVVEEKFKATKQSLQQFVRLANRMGKKLDPPTGIPYNSLKDVFAGKPFDKLRFQALADALECLLSDLASQTENQKLPHPLNSPHQDCAADDLFAQEAGGLETAVAINQGCIEITTDRDLREDEHKSLADAITQLLSVSGVRIRIIKGIRVIRGLT